MTTKPTKNRKISARELPAIRTQLLDQQGWRCMLCERDMRMVRPKQRCVDHDHAKTGPSAGAIRGVLCSNCNGNEGRINTRVVCSKGTLSKVEWLENLLNYWKTHRTNQTGLVHHTYKTPDELRLLRNRRARQRRAAKKKGK